MLLRKRDGGLSGRPAPRGWSTAVANNLLLVRGDVGARYYGILRMNVVLVAKADSSESVFGAHRVLVSAETSMVGSTGPAGVSAKLDFGRGTRRRG